MLLLWVSLQSLACKEEFSMASKTSYSDQQSATDSKHMEDYDTTLGAATTGVMPDVDIEQARQFLRDAQMVLVGLGYYGSGNHGDLAGEIDGVWGPRTADAVSTFQQDHSLDVSGQFDSETYEALMNAYDDELRVQLEETVEQDEALESAADALLHDDLDPDLEVGANDDEAQDVDDDLETLAMKGPGPLPH